jgi:NAD(P)-dependent dehydrogenase (short-subunit alcohol dehydrogenase family)
MFDLNVMSGVRLSRALMPDMLARGWGRIVFIGSDQSSKPNPSMSHYAMTKTALVSIARSLAELTRDSGVTVNTVQVAPTWTDGVDAFMHQMAEIEGTTPEEMSKAYFAEGEGRTSLLQRWAEPAEIANVVAFLCSPRASAINGSAPRADGGMVRALF